MRAVHRTIEARTPGHAAVGGTDHPRPEFTLARGRGHAVVNRQPASGPFLGPFLVGALFQVKLVIRIGGKRGGQKRTLGCLQDPGISVINGAVQ